MIGAMHKEYASLRRRPFLTPVWIFGLLGLLALGAAAWAVREASTTLVVVMRHADKLTDATADPALSPEGLERARRLATAFGSGPRELSIDAVFVTQWQRTAATGLPLATRLGIPVIPVVDHDIGVLEERIRHEYRGRRVLVVAHSDTVGQIVKALGQGTTVPEIAAGEYGTAYIVAIPRWSRPTVLAMKLP
jgi:broad specificity phosphatase PhoE